MILTKLELTIEDVLKGQGADPDVIKARKPDLLKIAQSALDIGMPLIQPKIFMRSFSILSNGENGIVIEGGIHINSTMISRFLCGAEAVEMVICTIGDELEKASAELFSTDASLALALDGLANAATDRLVEEICRELEAEAKAEGLNTSMPVSPGSDEWPLEIGQPVIFKAVKPDPSQIQLSDSYLMLPKKSSSFIVGIGREITKHGKTCDYCNVRETCRYKIRKTI